ncbi:MAG: alpha-amylase family glycosyl hydrolase [Verrucomicrobiota bacterium]|nr:alpha-amylase family glycosyl hydrolase [Verrucomicrobiota bacterium]
MKCTVTPFLGYARLGFLVFKTETSLIMELETIEKYQGACLGENGVHYFIWAPTHDALEIHVLSESGEMIRRLALDKQGSFFVGNDEKGCAGQLYKVFFPSENAAYPDIYSNFQPYGVHGPSEVIDHSVFKWSDNDWEAPRLRDIIFYEMHVGTFTDQGTYRAAAEKLSHLKQLGINAIEMMPLADCSGERNWGYDGVALYAPTHAYGRPDDLKYFINEAHRHGMSVFLDVVFNHIGPDGNYFEKFCPWYFNPNQDTPWGPGINFDGEGNKGARMFFRQNVVYWMDEFHFDGFRFDSIQSIRDNSPVNILTELTGLVNARGKVAVAEDERNLTSVIASQDIEGLGFNAVWAEDFANLIRTSFTGETHAHFINFKGTAVNIHDVLSHGWHFRGQWVPSLEEYRGAECSHIPPKRFVHYITNHDLVGNRPFGRRLNLKVSPESYRAVSLLLCLTPYTPFLFMGQEFSASSAFKFFTDYPAGDLAKAVTEGRKRDLLKYGLLTDEVIAEEIPDPQDVHTFTSSKLNWMELRASTNRGVFELYRAALKTRLKHIAFRPRDRTSWKTHFHEAMTIIEYGIGTDEHFLLLCDKHGKGNCIFDFKTIPGLSNASATMVISSNEVRFGSHGQSNCDPAAGTFTFRSPEAVLLRLKVGPLF